MGDVVWQSTPMKRRMKRCGEYVTAEYLILAETQQTPGRSSTHMIKQRFEFEDGLTIEWLPRYDDHALILRLLRRADPFWNRAWMALQERVT